jgi:hypothetical protein
MFGQIATVDPAAIELAYWGRLKTVAIKRLRAVWTVSRRSVCRTEIRANARDIRWWRRRLSRDDVLERDQERTPDFRVTKFPGSFCGIGEQRPPLWKPRNEPDRAAA